MRCSSLDRIPPLRLVFVLDVSGSLSEGHLMSLQGNTRVRLFNEHLKAVDVDNASGIRTPHSLSWRRSGPAGQHKFPLGTRTAHPRYHFLSRFSSISTFPEPSLAVNAVGRLLSGFTSRQIFKMSPSRA